MRKEGKKEENALIKKKLKMRSVSNLMFLNEIITWKKR